MRERKRKRKKGTYESDGNQTLCVCMYNTRNAKNRVAGRDIFERIQHKYCPRPNGVDPAVLPGGSLLLPLLSTWLSFFVKTRLPPPSLLNDHRYIYIYEFSYHLHWIDHHYQLVQSSLASLRHGAIAIAAQSNKTSEKQSYSGRRSQQRKEKKKIDREMNK